MIIEVAEAILKLSMDDLFIFKSITEKQSQDLQKLIKVWIDYSDMSEVTRQKFESKKVLTKEDFFQDHEITFIKVQAKKAEALIINEQEGCYIPLFFGQCEQLNFSYETDSEEKSLSCYVELSAGLDYFHASSGCYEPVIELFPIIINIIKVGLDTDT